MMKLPVFILLLTSFSASAQLTGAVAVEGEYDPLVIETERISEYPVAYRFELPQITLNYDTEGKTADFAPSLLTMGVTGWRTLRTGRLPLGYVDFRIGSFLNSRLDAKVWALRDSVNTLSADLRFFTTSLYKTHGIPDTYTAPVNRKIFDGTLGVNYNRLIGEEGLFSSRLDYRAAYFNYYGSVEEKLAGTADPKVPTQTVNQMDLKAGYASSPSLMRGWHASFDLGYISYRSFYYPGYAAYEREKGDRETRLGLEGGYAYGLGEHSAVALDVDADIVLYGKRRLDFKGYEQGDWRKDYALVTLTPAYRWKRSEITLLAGLDIDFAMGAMSGTYGKDYGVFHLAPDIKIDYRGKQFGMYLAATGGVDPVTLAGMEKFDMYQMPVLMSTQPVYTPIDARLGFCFGPYSGFSADLELRYAVANNTPVGGWYQALLGTYTGNYGMFDRHADVEFDRALVYGERINLHGLGIGLDLRYKLEGIVEASLRGDFTPQRGRTGIFNGYDRPRFVMDFNVAAYPVRKLRVEAGYSLRALRAIYGIDAESASEACLVSLPLPNVSMLKAKVGYGIFDNFEVYVAADNLLNRRVDYLPGLQSNGIAVSGGIYWEF